MFAACSFGCRPAEMLVIGAGRGLHRPSARRPPALRGTGEVRRSPPDHRFFDQQWCGPLSPTTTEQTRTPPDGGPIPRVAGDNIKLRAVKAPLRATPPGCSVNRTRTSRDTWCLAGRSDPRQVLHAALVDRLRHFPEPAAPASLASRDAATAKLTVSVRSLDEHPASQAGRLGWREVTEVPCCRPATIPPHPPTPRDLRR